MLFQQLETFRAEARDGNLQHDDLVDAMSMFQQLRRSKSGAVEEHEPHSVTSPLDALRAGESDYKHTGLNPMLGVNASQLTPDIVSRIIQAHHEGNSHRPSLAMRHVRGGR